MAVACHSVGDEQVSSERRRRWSSGMC